MIHVRFCVVLAAAAVAGSVCVASASFSSSSSIDLQKQPEVLTVDYGGLHPFEILAEERYRRLFAEQDDATKASTMNRNLQVNGRENYENIRITIYTDRLDELAAQDPSTSQHVEYAKSAILPAAVSVWEQALRVYPINESLTIPPRFSDICGGIEGTFNNTDLIITVVGYAGTDSTTTSCSNGQTLAAAYACAVEQFDRPILGVINLCFNALDLSSSNNDNRDQERAIGTVTHEIAHILGFTSQRFPYFYNPDTGLPRTQRPIPSRTVTCADGTTSQEVLPSTNTLKESFVNSNGQQVRHYEITTPTVTAVVRNQFHCFNMTGGRLENQPTSSNDCFGSHWDHRLYDTEIMSAVFRRQSRIMTPLTLALLEDSGWYVANYSMAQVASFGHGAGCDFVYKECIVNGNVPSYSENFFCAENGMEGCNADHTAVARCQVATYDNDLPLQYQYYDQPNVGGLLPQLEYCPVYFTIALGDGTQLYGDFVCTDSSLQQYAYEFETFGPESRCFEKNFNSPICLTTRCNEMLQAVQIIFGNEEVYTCEFDGQEIQLPGFRSRIIICPRLKLICPNLICPANCAGRGICDYTLPNPECVCNDVNDASPICANSPRFPTNDLWDDFIPGAERTNVPTISEVHSIMPTMTPHPSYAPSHDPSTKPTVSFRPSANLTPSDLLLPTLLPSRELSDAPSTRNPSSDAHSLLPTDAPIADISISFSPINVPIFSPTSSGVGANKNTPPLLLLFALAAASFGAILI